MQRGNEGAASGLLIMALGLNFCYASLAQRYWPNALLLVIKLHRLTFTLFLSVIVFSLFMLRLHSISLPEIIYFAAISCIIVALVILDIFLVNSAVKQGLIEKNLRYKQLKSNAIKSFSIIAKSAALISIVLLLAYLIKPKLINAGRDYLQTKFDDADAMHRLALFYDQQPENSNNAAKQAFYWLKLATEFGHKQSYLKLAEYYYQGRGTAKDYQQSFNALEKVGCAEDPCRARIALKKGGILAEGGFSIQQDLDYADYYFRDAFNAGAKIEAAKRLASLHLQQGNQTLVKQWYTQAVENGDIESAYQLGLLHSREDDYKKAFHFWSIARNSEQQSTAQALSINRLSELYASGRGIEQDIEQAHQLATASLEVDRPFAEYVLGYIELIRLDHLKTDAVIEATKVTAIRYLNSAINKGSAQAALQLGYQHFSGEFFEKDAIKATHYLSLARDGDETAASLYLAQISEKQAAHSDSQNHQEQAFKLYQEAANAGFTKAIFKVALYYDLGLSVPRSASQANQWYQKIATHGWHQLANLHLAINLYQELTGAENLAYEKKLRQAIAEKNYAAQREWYQHIRSYETLIIYLNRSISIGFENSPEGNRAITQARYNLALIHAGIDKDIHGHDLEAAHNNAIQAAEDGHPQAQYLLSQWYENGKTRKKDLKKSTYWRQKALESGVPIHTKILLDDTKHSG
jgi:TPR repeat protein